jgi:hypothetical protein
MTTNISRTLRHPILLTTLLFSASSLRTMDLIPKQIPTEWSVGVALGTFALGHWYSNRKQTNAHEATIADIKKTMEESALTLRPLGFIKHTENFDRAFHEQTAPRIKRSFISHTDPLKQNLPFTICYETADRYEQKLIQQLATIEAANAKNDALEQLKKAATQEIAQLNRFKRYLVNTEVHKEYESEQQALAQRIKEQREYNIRLQENQEQVLRARNSAALIEVEAQKVKGARERAAADRETARATRQHTQELKHHVLCHKEQQKLEKKYDDLDQRHHKLQRTFEELTQKNNTLTQHHQQLTNDKNVLIGTANSLRDEKAKIAQDLRTSLAQKATLEKEIAQLAQKQRDAQAELTTFHGQAGQTAAQQKELHLRIAAHEESIKKLTQQRDATEARIIRQRNTTAAILQKLKPILQQWKDAEGFPNATLSEAIALCEKQQQELNA